MPNSRTLSLITFLLMLTMAIMPAHIASADGLDLGSAMFKATERLTSEEANDIDGKELHCLTKAVYYEARGEPLQGKAAVAWVILNRVSFGFAPSICEVVHQGEGTTTCQFTFVCIPNPAPVNSSLFDACRKVAYDVLIRKMYAGLVPGAVNFHSVNVDPGWNNLKLVKQVGTQLFYRR
jgi:hypothetical protein